ncbi:hypothetical protein NHX12_011964 [Muraenolepis orangiensis]|uniref:Uncharacterized protein n=1 Tax=Muraenolepis orangiensis TaxID=630683 RepID=A0A9Q0I9B5_9TELE|nr:hypothetical protein NHX12_011964 [Muraenolepis orangiensis]
MVRPVVRPRPGRGGGSTRGRSTSCLSRSDLAYTAGECYQYLKRGLVAVVILNRSKENRTSSSLSQPEGWAPTGSLTSTPFGVDAAGPLLPRGPAMGPRHQVDPGPPGGRRGPREGRAPEGAP